MESDGQSKTRVKILEIQTANTTGNAASANSANRVNSL